ncbi:hypothetical protein CHH91_12125 [Virgibacillus sp. 7505]|uniref:thiol-disulfide oxidoreductase DCC family protein n=1 Tax=Virgibacillus sp. 7505 TaxID=2022548 RepID=UPI000BA54DCF|nr:DUF393 domain-containing protein [Virgibacillus sp. 7505]PAE15705.1 hypothetical protein CHH91_12125 [Virgibacillus sp. 7505]
MKHIVFFDASCPLCSTAKQVIQKLDWLDNVKWIPVQNIENYERFRFLAKGDVYDRIHMMSFKGDIYKGHETVKKVLTLLPVTAVLGWILHLPFLNPYLESLYKWVSDNRHDWFGTKQLKAI